MMASTSNSKPLYAIKVPLSVVLFVSVCIPFISLASVATLGALVHFKETTSTHCNVPNFIPTVSAVVARVEPEHFIWRLGIAFMSSPRILDSFIYYNLFAMKIKSKFYKYLNVLLFVVYWVQCLGLYGLTYVSSTDNYILHRNCFISFIVGSITHMLLFLYMTKKLRQPPSPRDETTFKLRAILATSHILVFFTSLYFFWRHNTYCEPYVYSLYGLFEYLMIITNIAFYGVMFVDLQNCYLTMNLPSTLKKEDE